MRDSFLICDTYDGQHILVQARCLRQALNMHEKFARFRKKLLDSTYLATQEDLASSKFREESCKYCWPRGTGSISVR